MTNADLVKLLEIRLAEARAGTITDALAVFGGPPGGTGGYALTALDDASIPRLLGDFEIFKPQVVGLYIQQMQKRAGGIVQAKTVPPIPANVWKKMNGG